MKFHVGQKVVIKQEWLGIFNDYIGEIFRVLSLDGDCCWLRLDQDSNNSTNLEVGDLCIKNECLRPYEGRKTDWE